MKSPSCPLRDATIDDLEKYPWPNLTNPARFAGLAERAKAIQAAGYATVLLPGVTIFEQACLMRGLDAVLMDLAADEEFFTALINKLKSLADSLYSGDAAGSGPLCRCAW